VAVLHAGARAVVAALGGGIRTSRDASAGAVDNGALHDRGARPRVSGGRLVAADPVDAVLARATAGDRARATTLREREELRAVDRASVGAAARNEHALAQSHRL